MHHDITIHASQASTVPEKTLHTQQLHYLLVSHGCAIIGQCQSKEERSLGQVLYHSVTVGQVGFHRRN